MARNVRVISARCVLHGADSASAGQSSFTARQFARTVSTNTEKGHEPARFDFRRSGAQDPVSSPLEFGHANGRPVASIAIRYGKLDRDTDCSEGLNGFVM